MSATYTILDSAGATLYSGVGDSLGVVVAMAVADDTPLNDAQLIGADLSGLDLTNGQFVGANLQGARIVGSNLTNASFRVANLTGADLSTCIVTGTEFSSQSLVDANIGGTNMLAANVVYGVTGGDTAYANATVPAGNTIANALSGEFATKYSVPLQSLVVGDVIRVTARGGWSATGVGPSITVNLGIGSVTIGSFVSGNMTTKPTDNGWSMSVDCTLISTGEEGTMEIHGTCLFGLSDGTSIARNIYNSDPESMAIDTTVPTDVTFSVVMSAAASGNSVVLRQLIVEILKA